MYYFIKIFISAFLILLISEFSKKSSIIAGLLASIPLTSLLAIIWIYIEKKDTSLISNLSADIFFLVLPSLIFFLLLPLMLKKGINFYISIISSLIIMVIFYLITLYLLKTFKN